MIKEYIFYNTTTCEENEMEICGNNNSKTAVNLHFLELWEIKDIFEQLINCNTKWSHTDIILARCKEHNIDYYYMQEPSLLSYVFNTTHYYNIDFHYVDKIIRIEYSHDDYFAHCLNDCIR